MALPALTLNYFGQGGLLLAEANSPDVLRSPFYALAPQWAHFPLIILAAAATVIASQSIISGAYSMTQQAISLGFLPRMKSSIPKAARSARSMSPRQLGARHRHPDRRYRLSLLRRPCRRIGIAVSLLMVITTLMATFVALHWKHNHFVVYTVNGSLLALDLLFFASTSTKLFDGGWFPLLIAFVISFLMLTWRKGEEVMDRVRLEIREPSSEFVARLRRDPPLRIPGTAIVLGRMAKGVPLALSHNVNCNHVLHERVLLVAANVTEAPRAPDHDRFVVAPIAEGITRLELRFGFMEEPDVPARIAEAMASGKIETFDLARATYYTGHETIIPSGRRPGLPRWREALFAFLHHNAQRPGLSSRFPALRSWKSGSNSRSEFSPAADGASLSPLRRHAKLSRQEDRSKSGVDFEQGRTPMVRMFARIVGLAFIALSLPLAVHAKTFYWISHGSPADPVWTYFLAGAEIVGQGHGANRQDIVPQRRRPFAAGSDPRRDRGQGRRHRHNQPRSRQPRRRRQGSARRRHTGHQLQYA